MQCSTWWPVAGSHLVKPNKKKATGGRCSSSDSHRHSPGGVVSDVTAHWLLERLDGVHVTGDGWMARCPAHDDHTPSLSFRVTQSAVVLLHCFAGCQLPDICEALGIEVRDLFPSREWSEPALGRPQDNGARSEAEGKTGLDDPGVDRAKPSLEDVLRARVCPWVRWLAAPREALPGVRGRWRRQVLSAGWW